MKAVYDLQNEDSQVLVNLLRSDYEPLQTKARKSRLQSDRHVRFAPEESNTMILYVDDTEESARWLSGVELEAIWNGVGEFLLRYRDMTEDGRGRGEKNSEHSSRGLLEGCTFDYQLEKFIEEYRIPRHQVEFYNRRQVILTILNHQEDQAEMGFTDPTSLRICSRSLTQFSEEIALEQGRRDFEDALLIWKGDPDCATHLESMVASRANSGTLRGTFPSSFTACLLRSKKHCSKDMQPEELQSTLKVALDQVGVLVDF